MTQSTFFALCHAKYLPSSKKFTGRLGNKPCLIWLLKIPPNLTYVTIVLCNLLLITALVFDRPPFSDVSVSQCSVAMHMRCGGIAANLLENLTVRGVQSVLSMAQDVP